ncbi:MAG TPA: lipoyl(octanoyl) transferase LipB [Burkholderiales bacterium]|nr:lipoyl(octanoyl) transferase LipB [Burkholderiales bacterium]
MRKLGLSDYEKTWRAMQRFSAVRATDTPDELWLVEHPPVYTVGLNGKEEHLLRTDNGIPLVKTDRGGQITYHGPGQIIVYTLLDLRRRGLGVRALVRKLENAVIELLMSYGVEARGRVDAPGVYVGGAKVAALGLRIRNGCCFHGLSLNVDVDLGPFHAIDPCGYPGLQVTRLRDLGIDERADLVADKLLANLADELSSPSRWTKS